MTVRALSVVWAVVLIVVIGFTAFMERLGASVFEKPLDIGGAEVVVVGSSLIRDAVPWDPVEGGIFGDGRLHKRLAKPLIDERMSLKYLRDAITGGATIVVVEISAFSFDYNRNSPEKTGPVSGPTRFDFIRDFSARIDLGIQQLGDEDDIVQDISYEYHDPREEFDGVPREKYNLLFPLYPKRPKYDEALREQIRRAKMQGTDIVFVSMPRSATVEAYMSAEEYDALIDHQRAIAAEYGVPLIVLGPFWPDDHFRDISHPNIRGRERFLSEIADWIEARR